MTTVYQPQSLDDKGRCCGRKPIVYKRPVHRLTCAEIAGGGEAKMTEEEQEAESLRYADAIKVLPLSSGRIALLGPRNELHKIVDNWTEVLDNIESLRTAFRYVPTKPSAQYTNEIAALASINIELDL